MTGVRVRGRRGAGAGAGGLQRRRSGRMQRFRGTDAAVLNMTAPLKALALTSFFLLRDAHCSSSRKSGSGGTRAEQLCPKREEELFTEEEQFTASFR